MSILWGTGGTVISLFGGTLPGALLGETVFELLPGRRPDGPGPVNIALAAIPAVAGLLAGGAGCGIWMGRLAWSGERRRMAIAGLLGFAPTTAILAFTLLRLESAVAGALETVPPVHRLFMIVFTGCAFAIAGVSTRAIGRAHRMPGDAWSPALKVGLASPVGFLAINLAMGAAGWVVGAPLAAERATMLTVMFSGMLGAGLLGGGLLGRSPARLPSDPATHPNPGSLAG
jgi:hypothetical protein